MQWLATNCLCTGKPSSIPPEVAAGRRLSSPSMKGQPEADGVRAHGRAAMGDALIYASCAVAAFGVRVIASIPLQREWALLAAGPYCGAAVIAAAPAVRPAGLRARALRATAGLLG